MFLTDIVQLLNSPVVFSQVDLQNISPPQSIFEERLQGNESAASRVDAMLEQIRKKIEKPPTFLLCVLPDKNSDIYGLLYYLAYIWVY